MTAIPVRRLPLPLRYLPLLNLFQTPVSGHLFSSSSSISEPTPESLTTKTSMSLTQEQLTKINLLIPRLCLYSHHSTAIRLVDAALLRYPPLESISISILIDALALASQSDMTGTMSLLTRLKHHPNAHLYLSPIATMVICSYCKRQQSKEALKVFNWMVRPGSLYKPEEKVYKILIPGLCRNRMVPDALKVLKNMIDSNLVPDSVLRNWVFRCLLREAMIDEAMELNEALDCVGYEDSYDYPKKVLTLLDRIITNWVE